MIEELIRARLEQGLSMSEIARRIGTSPSVVHSWEHRIRVPSLVNYMAWAEALGYRVVLWRNPHEAAE